MDNDDYIEESIELTESIGISDFVTPPQERTDSSVAYPGYNSSEPLRFEEPWSNEIEELLARWKIQVEKLSFLHDESGYLIKARYYRLVIPATLIPFVMTFLSQILPNDEITTATIGVMFMITSIMTGLQTLFSYGQLYEKHFQYSSRYSDIVNRIDTELSRQRKYRVPSDVFVMEVKCKIDNLNDTSPELPMNCF